LSIFGLIAARAVLFVFVVTGAFVFIGAVFFSSTFLFIIAGASLFIGAVLLVFCVVLFALVPLAIVGGSAGVGT
jgi:hypothetical protein